MDTYQLTFRAMGCQVEIQLETRVNGSSILERIPDRVEAIEAKLSRFRPESELMLLNAQAGEWVTVSDELCEVIHMAKHAARQTQGLFNPLVLNAMVANGYDRSFEQIQQPSVHSTTIGTWQNLGIRLHEKQIYVPEGSAIDLGGMAKGWTAALIADDLAQYGACLVNIGGDIVVRGAPQDSNGWQIELEDPHTKGILLELVLHDTAVMTSGIDYRRWTTADGHLRHHIIDPRTGNSARTDIETVTVIHPHATTAEAYTKAVLLLGSENGLAWLNLQWDAAGLVIRQDGTVLSTSNFNHYISERVQL